MRLGMKAVSINLFAETARNDLSHAFEPGSVDKKIDMRTMHIDIPINIGMSYEIHFDLTTSNCLC